MKVTDMKEILRTSKGVSEEQVREVIETIREVEELGVKRSYYNLASPFARLGGGTRDVPSAARRELKNRVR